MSGFYHADGLVFIRIARCDNDLAAFGSEVTD